MAQLPLAPPQRPDPARLMPLVPGNQLPAIFHPAPPDAPEGEGELSLRELWRVLMRRKWAVISTFMIVVVAAAIGTAQITPVYRGSVTVQIDRQAQKIVNFEANDPGASDYDYNNSYINTYIEVLKSRALAERVVAQLGLRERDEGATKPKQGVFDWLQSFLGDGKKKGPEPNVNEQKRDGAVSAMMGALLVEPIRNSRIVRISFDSTDPEVAARVANQVAQTFIELNLERRMDASSYAKTFLEERLQQVKSRLEDSEKKLVGYARKEDIVAINEKQNLSTAKLDQVQQELAKVQMERIHLESSYQELQDSPGPVEADHGQPGDPGAEAQQDQAGSGLPGADSKVFKPAFPKMQQLKAQIDELQTKIDSEVAALRAASKADLDAAVRREQMLNSLLGQARGEVLTGQDHSIDYNILKREVDTNRNMYDGLLQRLKEVSVAARLRWCPTPVGRGRAAARPRWWWGGSRRVRP